MCRKYLLLAITAAFALSVPLMAWSDQAQSESHYSSGTESGTATQGGVQSQKPASGTPLVGPSAAGRASDTEAARSQSAINPEQYLHKDVVNTNGENVGQVDTLVTYDRTGSIEAVIDVGGFMGIGAKKIVVPLDQLQLKADKVVLNASLTKDQLKQGTPYNRSEFSAFEPEPQNDRSTDRQKDQ